MRRTITPLFLSFLFVIGMTFTLNAQISRPGTPLSIEKNAPAVSITETFNPAVDWNVIQQEDDLYKQQGGYAPRAGLSVPVGRRITEFGEWLLMPNGDMMWRVQLHSDSAKALGVVFSDFYMPDNAELYVYDANKQMIAGAFTSENNHSSMMFSTRLLPSSTIIIEYIEKGAGGHLIDRIPDAGYNEFVLRTGGVPVTNYQPQTNFRIDELMYMYKDVYTYFDQSRPATGASQACQVDIVCSPVGDNYTDQKRGVAHMVFREGASWYYCSGTLVNNTLQNGVPYFLTAYHCGGVASAADHNVWQFYFNYERPNCGSGTPPTSDMMTGCVLRSGYEILNGSDFQLVELNSNVPLSYSPFYNGWDRSTVGATSGASIHHPAGDVKKISTFTAQLTSSTPNIGGDVMATNSAWRVVWSSNPNGWGVTEGGSSGSPIFNQHGRQVGTLTGGSSTCASPTSADFYGKFDYHWISNGTTSDVQLRPWLDPAGTDPAFLDGWDPTWVSAPPVADFVADQTNIVAGTTVQFTDLSTNGPNQWTWTITGAFPATSNQRNPQITFIDPGQYTVTLTSSNSYGADTETKVNYITVSALPPLPPTNPLIIGTGTVGSLYPMGCNSRNTAQAKFVRSASIYTAAEIGGGGQISSLAWYANVSQADLRTVKIYMKHTTASTLTSTTVDNIISDAVLVFDGTYTPNAVGWHDLVLNNSFIYNGIDNLMVIMLANHDLNNADRTSDWRFTASTNRHQRWNGNTAPTGNGTIDNNRPNIRITFDPILAPVADFTLPNIIYFEGFEEATTDGSLPAGWTQKRTTNLNDNPVTDAVAPMWFNNSANYGFAAWQDYVHTGVGSMATGYTAPDFTWAISPDIVLPNTTGLELRYWTWWFSDASWQTNYYVKVLADGVWTTIQSNLGSAANTNEYVSEVVLSLAAYQNKTIKIAFVYQYTDGYQMAIDDISIVDDAIPTHVTLFEGESTTFYDASTNNPIVWSWQLPGGTPGTASDQNPTIQYNVAGWYDVSLTAANAAGSDTETKTNYVEVVGRPPVSDFYGTGNLKTVNYQPFIPLGGTVEYFDESIRIPATWTWTFDGGTPGSHSGQTPPIITYNTLGNHNTTLYTANLHGNDTKTDTGYVVVGGTQYITNWYETDGLAVYNWTNGLIPGHGSDGTYQIYKYADFFTNSYAGEISNIDIAINSAQGVGKNVSITIWDGSTGSPGTVLWTTTLPITDFVEGSYNTIPVSPVVNVTGDFFVGYELNYDAGHNYTTHQFCSFITQFRGDGNPNSAWISIGTATPGDWFSLFDVFGENGSILIEPEFTYASVGPVATVSATPGCATGTVRVTSSENTNQTFHLTDDVGTILDSWTGNAQFRDFTGLANGTYRGQVVVGVQTSPLSAAVVLTNDPATVGGNVNGVNAEICLGSNTGTLTLSGHTGSVLRWQRQLNGGGWNDIAHTATTYSEVPASAGNWEYRAEVQSGSCPAAFSTAFTVLVHPATVAGSVSGVNSEICLGQSTGTLTLSGYTGSVVRWERRYNAGAWQNITNTNNIHSETPGAAGTYEYRAVVQSGTCTALNSASYTITVHPVSVGGSVTGTNTEICLGSATGTMTLSGHAGSIVRWERNIDGGGWTTIANTTTTHSETPGTAGSYQYRAVVKSGSCAETFSAAHTITVHPVSVGGTLNGVNTEICLGANTGTMTLSGHTGSVVRWQRRIDGGGWTNIANTTTSHSETPVLAGVYDYRVEVRSGNCTSVYSSLHTITVHPASVGGSVSAAATQICLGASTGTLTLSGHTGSIVRWERNIDGGGWTSIANTTTTHSETPGTAGSYQYRAVVQSGSCAETFSAAHTITVHPVSVGGTLNGVNTEICLGANTGTMTLSGHTGSIVRWQRRIDGGIWTNIANTTTTHSETPGTAGVYDYRVEVRSGNCTSVYSSLHTITVHPASVGGSVTAAATQICLGASTGTLTLSGHTGSIVRWERNIDGGGWTSIANTTTTHSETPGTAGSYQYRAVVQSGSCAESYSATHTITVHPVTVGGAVNGPNTQICLGESTGTMTLSGHTGSVVRWQRQLNGGGWTNITNTTTTHSEIPASEGLWEYRTEVQSGNCASEYSVVFAITVNPGSAGGTVSGANTEICLGLETGIMTLSGHTGTIVKWQKQLNGGGWTDISNTNTTYNETPLTAGVWEYRAVVQSGLCPEAYSTLHTITVYPVTVAGAVNGATTEICMGDPTGVMTLSGHTGSVVRWQKRVDGGVWTSITNTNTTYSETPSGTGVWDYRAEVKSGTCSNDFSTAHTITVYPATVAGSVTGVNSEICLGSSTGTMTLGGYSGTITKWQRSIDGGVWQDIAHVAATYSETPATAGIYEYRAAVQSGICGEAFSTSHSIEVHPLTVGGSVSGATTEICLGSSTGTMTLSGHTGTVVRWERSIDGGAWQNIVNTTTTHSETPGTAGNYQYRAVVQSGSCAVEYSSAHAMTVYPATVAGSVIGASTEICLGSATGTLTLGGYTGNIVRWQRQHNGGGWVNIVHTAATYSETPALSGVWEYRAVVQSGVCAEAFSAAHSITVHPVTVGGSVSGATTEICLGASTGAMNLTGHTGSVVRWERSIDGGAWQNITNTTTTHSATPGTPGVYQYRAVVQSGTCAVEYSSAHTITVYPATVAGSVTGASTEICLGSATGTLTLGGYTGNIVRWQRQHNGGGWVNIVHTAATYSETPALSGVWEYRAVVQSGVCAEAFSAAHSITVNPLTVGGSTSTGIVQIFIGQPTDNITLSGHTGSVVRWQKRHDGGPWTDIPFTGTVFSETPNLIGFWDYRAVVQSGVCSEEFSTFVQIEVLPSDAGGVIGGNSPICLGSNTGIMTLTGYSGSIVRWEKRVDGGAWSPIAHTLDTYSEVPSSSGIWDYRAVVFTTVELFSAPATIEVNPLTVGGTISGVADVCLGNTTGNLTLSGHTGTILKWQRQYNGGGWVDITHTGTIYSEVPALAGNYEYRAQVQSGVCAADFSTVHMLIVHPVTVGGNVTGVETEICIGSNTGTLTLGGYTGSIVKWQVSVDGGAWTDIAHTGATYSEVPASSGTYAYRAVVQSGSCGTANSTAHTITVHPATVAGAVTGPNTEICLGASTGTLTLGGYTGTILNWQVSVDGGAWTNIAHTNPTYSAVPGAAGTYAYRAVVKSGVCGEENSAEHTITVYPPVAGGNVTAATTEICLGQPTGTLTLSGHSGTIVKWQRQINAGGWVDIPHTGATYSEVPALAGTYEYRAQLESGSCGTAFSGIHTITVYPVTAGGSVSGANTEICLGNSTGTLTLSGYTGTIVKWQKQLNGGGWTDISHTGATYSEVPGTAGVWEYRAEVQSGICGTQFSSAHTITVYPVSVGGNVAGANTEICVGSSTGTMTLSAHTGTIVRWERSVDGGAWQNIVNNSTTHSETPGTAGTYVYRAVIQSGVCNVTYSTTHTITVYPATVAGSVGGTLTELCLGTNTGTLTLSGHTGTIVKWQKQLNAGVWTDITNTTTTYSEVPSSAGTWNYRAVVQSGVCGQLESAMFTITVYPLTVGGNLTGPSTELCLGQSTGTMTLSGYAGSIVKWQVSYNGGMWTDIPHTGATYSETPGLAGTYSYRAQIQSGTCGTALSTAHTITVYPMAVGGTVNPALTNIFLGDPTGTLTLSGHSGTITKWQKQHNGGGWVDITHTGVTYSETPALSGTWEYRVVISSGVCTSQYSSIATVIVDGADPGTLSGGNSPICFGASTGLMSLTGYTGTIIRWEKSLDGGAWMPITHTANFYFETPSAPGTWQYRAVVMGVSEMFSNAVTIVVDPPLNTGTLSGGGTICVGASTPLMTLSGYSENIVKWEYRFNGGTWTDILHTGATYSEVPATAGLYEYRVFVESGSCGTAYSDVVSVTVDPALAAGVLTNGGVTICEGSQTPVLTLTAYSGNIVKWQKSDDGAIWTDISHTSNTYQEIPSSTGTWYYRVVVESGACGTANSTVQFVSVDPATDAGTLAGLNTQICIGAPTGLMTLSGYEGNIVQWQYRFDGGVWTDITHTSSTYNETPLLAGTYEYRVEVQSGVCGAEYSNIWLIDVYPTVVAGFVDGTTSICEGYSTGILTLTGYTGNVVRWQKSDDGVNWTDIAHTADTYSEIPVSAGVWHYRAEVESGTCGSAYSVAAIVTVDETTVAGVLSAVMTDICLGADTDVMTLSAYTGSVVKWQYRVDGGSWIDIAVTNDVYTDTPATSGLYEYRVEVQNGACDELTSNIVAINVHALPVAGTLSASNSAICENESTGLMTVSGYTGTIVQWQKRLNAGTWIDIAHTANTYSEVISTPGTWDFRVEIGSGSCGSTSTNMVTIQVGSTTIPGIIDGNETEICLGESTDIMVVTGFTGSVVGWQKRVNMGAWIDIPMSNSPTYTEVPNQAGTWHYRAIVQSGSCASGYTDPYEIEVFAVPEAEFTYAITNYTVSFINTSTNATSYLWDFGDGNSSTDKHPIHTYTSSGMKTVTLTAYNGICEDEFSLTLSITVSVHEFDNDSYVTIYPNPSDDGKFNISFMVDGKYTEFDIVIYDITGRIIYSENVSNITNGTVHPVSLTDTAAGAYRIRFVSTEGQFEKLLIIQ